MILLATLRTGCEGGDRTSRVPACRFTAHRPLRAASMQTPFAQARPIYPVFGTIDGGALAQIEAMAANAATTALAGPTAPQSQPAQPQATNERRANPCIRQTPARLTAIFKQLNAYDYPSKMGYGQKTKAQQEVVAKLTLDKENFPSGVPNVITVFKWVDEAVAKRKADVGTNADKDYTGAGDESDEDALEAGRDYVSFILRFTQHDFLPSI